MTENKTITLKATDFQYPSKEELKKITNNTPAFKLFSFPYENELTNFLNDELDFNLKESKKKSDLYWWSHSLKNRIGKLIRAYTLTIINFDRSFPDEFEDCNDQNYIHRIQFDFYCETYFYFFASVRDTIAQIINVYYNIGCEEDNVYFNKKFISKIRNNEVNELVVQFISDTSETIDFRNKFTHHFSITHPDYRTSYSEEDGKQTLGAGLGNFTKSSDLATQIKLSLEQIATFITNLATLMP